MKKARVKKVMDDALFQVPQSDDALLQLSPKLTRKLFLWSLLNRNTLKDKGAQAILVGYAKRGDLEFFKDLGRVLLGKKRLHFADKREAFLLELMSKNPGISNRHCMGALRKAGFHEMTDDNFRNFKKRLFDKVKIIPEPRNKK